MFKVENRSKEEIAKIGRKIGEVFAAEKAGIVTLLTEEQNYIAISMVVVLQEFQGNVFFLPLFFFYWIFMSVLMKCTEEKWLKNLYGREYEEYCKRVKRCIPWLQRSGR